MPWKLLKIDVVLRDYCSFGSSEAALTCSALRIVDSPGEQYAGELQDEILPESYLLRAPLNPFWDDEISANILTSAR
jgi:hypothetical protein